MKWLKNLLAKKATKTVLLKRPLMVWIHGANATPYSFSYLKLMLPLDLRQLSISYSTNEKFYSNLEDMIDLLKDKGPIFIVGHSMGGLYALHLANHPDIHVAGVVSISTPFRGSSTAEWAKFLVRKYQLFRDVGRNSEVITNSRKIRVMVPWTQIVTTDGNVPWHGGKNDGTVTIASMKDRSDVEFRYIKSCHHEVLVHPLTATVIRELFYKNV